MDQFYENHDRLTLQLKLRDLADGIYAVRKGVLRPDQDCLHRWLNMGDADELRMEDITYLKQAVIPDVRITKCLVKNGSTEVTVEMEPNEIDFIDIGFVKEID